MRYLLIAVPCIDLLHDYFACFFNPKEDVHEKRDSRIECIGLSGAAEWVRHITNFRFIGS